MKNITHAKALSCLTILLLFNFKTSFSTEYSLSQTIGSQPNLTKVSSVVEAANQEIYLADASKSEIRVYSNSGVFLRKWNTSSVEFICSSPSGSIYGIPKNGSVIYKYSSTGSLLSTLAGGQIIYANGITTDQNENIYVIHNMNSVKKFNSLGQFQMLFGGSNDVIWDARAVVVTNGGVVHLLHDGNWLGYSISSFNADGTVINHGGDPFVVNASMSNSFTTDAAGNFYISNNHTITKFNPSKQLVATWGKFGSGNGEFKAPFIAMEHTGLLLVADQNDRIQKINTAGIHQITYGSNVLANGEMGSTAAAAYDSDGNIYVVDKTNCFINKFDGAGNFKLRFGSSGNGNSQFVNISDIVVSNSGDVFVSEYKNGNDGNARIQKFTNGGVYISQWNVGGGGAKPMAFTNEPTQRLVIGDASSSKIYICNLTGITQSSWGVAGKGIGQLDGIVDLCISPSNEVCILQYTFSSGYIAKVQKFNLQGDYQFSFGSYGATDGLLKNVTGIEFDDNGDFLISDFEKIQRFNSTGVYQRKFAVLPYSYYGKITRNKQRLLLPSNGSFTEYLKDLGTRVNDLQILTLNVYPNPSSGKVYFVLPDGETALKVQSFDAMGNNVIHGVSLNEIQLNIPGVFIVEVQTEKAVYYSKILVRN